jgi:hypothetical protein
MSAVETLRMLAMGERPVSGLLHTVRLEAFGVEAYGEEAVVESFRSSPFELSETAITIEAPGHIAVFDGSTAMIADLYGDNIARIWRLGDGDVRDGEPGVSVVFDPDLAQARGDVFFAASDHPDLDHDCAKAAVATGHLILDNFNCYRARAFCIRAFGTIDSFATLFAVFILNGDGARTAGYSMASAIYNSDGAKLVNDSVGQSAVELQLWTPRVGE